MAYHQSSIALPIITDTGVDETSQGQLSFGTIYATASLPYRQPQSVLKATWLSLSRKNVVWRVGFWWVSCNCTGVVQKEYNKIAKYILSIILPLGNVCVFFLSIQQFVKVMRHPLFLLYIRLYQTKWKRMPAMVTSSAPRILCRFNPLV